MPKKRTLMAAMVVVGLLAAFSLAGVAFAQGATTASAELRDPQGNPVGTAEFAEGANGVSIAVNITGGIEPGVHAIHIHEKGDLSSSDFKSAGDHFNPTGAEHGFDNPRGPHAGDLENITVAEDGTASYQTVNERITLSGGPNSIFDEDGSALVVHAMADDYRTDDHPDSGPGTSGDRIAAGAIEATEALPETGGMNLLAWVAIPVLLALGGASVLVFRRLRQA